MEQILAEEIAFFILGKISGLRPPTGSQPGDYLKHLLPEISAEIQAGAKRTAKMVKNMDVMKKERTH